MSEIIAARESVSTSGSDVDGLVKNLEQINLNSDSTRSTSHIFTVSDRVRCEIYNSPVPKNVIIAPTATTLNDLIVNISNSFNGNSAKVLVIPTSLLPSDEKRNFSRSQAIESIVAHCISVIKEQPESSIVEVLQFYLPHQSLYEQVCKIFRKLTGTRMRSQSHTTHDYYKRELKSIDATGYKAAGLVLYRKNHTTGEYEFLLGETDNELTTLGGKIDKTDQTVYDTAVREFNEETSLLLGTQHIEVIRSHLVEKGEGSRVMWYSGGKFALCFLSIDEVPGLYEATESLPQRMQELHRDSERWGRLPAFCREMDGLRWISTTEFKALENKKLSKFLSRMKTSIGFEAWLGSLKGSEEYPKFAERFRSNTV